MESNAPTAAIPSSSSRNKLPVTLRESATACCLEAVHGKPAGERSKKGRYGSNSASCWRKEGSGQLPAGSLERHRHKTHVVHVGQNSYRVFP